MYSLSLLPILGLAAVAFARAAPESQDSPLKETFAAVFNDKVVGGVLFYSNDGFVSVGVDLDLPKEGAPYSYQVHTRPVHSVKDCSAAQGDFNPYDGSKDAKTPAEMEVGDLSGKHGMISGDSIFQIYEDRYMSLNPYNEASILGLSVVVESSSGERIACGNIEKLGDPLSPEAKKLVDKLQSRMVGKLVT